MYINASGVQLRLSAKATNVVQVTQGRDVLSGTAGHDVFHMVGGDVGSGGAGDDTYYIYDAGSVAVEKANGGIDTVDSRVWGSATLGDNIENLILGGRGSTVGIGNALDNIIFAGTVGAVLNGMKGDDILVGGSGSDKFQIAKGNGSDVITNFTHAKDMISLSGYDFANFADLKRASNQTGDDVTIRLGGGESLILRDTKLSTLSTSDFEFGINKVGQMGANAFDQIAYDKNAASQQMWGGNAVFVNKGWYVLNGAWNTGGLTEWKDFKINSYYTKENVGQGITFNWDFKENTGPFPIIRAYPDLLFGAGPKGNSYDNTKTFPIKVDDLVKLDAKYDLSYRGDADGFNVAFDFYLTSVPNGKQNAITNEVMIWLHEGDFPAFGERVGVYEDGDFSATIWHSASSKYTAFVANDDWDKGTIDVVKIIDKLVDMGLASRDSYFASIQLGSEVVEGEGSLTINNFALDVQARNMDGSITQKLVSGNGVITNTLPATQEPSKPADPIKDADPDPIPVVHAPSAVNDKLAAMNEDDVRVIKVSELLGNDAANGSNPLKLNAIDKVVGGSASLSADGTEVRFVADQNFNGAASFTYSVSNGSGTSSATASFMVNPVNDAPSGLNFSIRSAAENSKPGTVVGKLSGTDVDAGDHLRYTLVDDAGGRFKISSAGDSVIVGDGASLDFEKAVSHRVTVRATDDAGAYFDRTFTIVVTDIDETAGKKLYDGTSADDVITLTTSDDWTVNGMGGVDRITTGNGNDIVDGGAGNDIISTGGGNDVILFSLWSGSDTVNGGAGYDMLRADRAGAQLTWGDYSSIEAISSGGFDNVRIVGTSASETIDLSQYDVQGIAAIDGGGGDDVITGTNFDDVIIGSNGNDVMYGLGGNDLFLIGPNSRIDKIDGGAGYDEVRATADDATIGWGGFRSIEAISSGGFANVELRGGNDDDIIDLSNIKVSGIKIISGGRGNDTIIGTSGDDVIAGLDGADRLTGGVGSDTFVFTARRESRDDMGNDTITDFVSGVDRIDLSLIDANTRTAGNDAFTFIGTGAFDGQRGALRYDNSKAGETHVMFDVNGDKVADFDLVLLGHHTLTATDFIL